MISSLQIKALAHQTGFDLCGITPCRHLAFNEEKFHVWLDNGFQSSLSYMERNSEKRFDPRLLVENSKTVVVCAVSYKNDFDFTYPPAFPLKVASYACNRDYHDTIREMLHSLFQKLKEYSPSLMGRCFVDTAPLAEKQLAVEAGLGWIGRQSLLITPQFGSFVLLGELVLCEEVDKYDTPYNGVGCGSCHRCMEHCPTHAIVEERVINTNRCISCHTIEKEPRQNVDLHGWIFGCDECQMCCPYNQRTPLHRHPNFKPLFDPKDVNAQEWLSMSEAEFRQRFGTSPMTRSGLERIQENVRRNLAKSEK